MTTAQSNTLKKSKSKHIQLTPEQEEMLLDLQLIETFSVRDFLATERSLLESLHKANLVTRFNGNHLLHVSALGHAWCQEREKIKSSQIQARIDLIEKIAVVLDRVVSTWVTSDEFIAICQPRYSRDRRLKNKTLKRVLGLFARIQKAATLPSNQLICHEVLRCAIAAQSWTVTVAGCAKISRPSYSEYLLFIAKSIKECVEDYQANPQVALKDTHAHTDKLLYAYKQELRAQAQD